MANKPDSVFPTAQRVKLSQHVPFSFFSPVLPALFAVLTWKAGAFPDGCLHQQCCDVLGITTHLTSPGTSVESRWLPHARAFRGLRGSLGICVSNTCLGVSHVDHTLKSTDCPSMGIFMTQVIRKQGFFALQSCLYKGKLFSDRSWMLADKELLIFPPLGVFLLLFTLTVEIKKNHIHKCLKNNWSF